MLEKSIVDFDFNFPSVIIVFVLSFDSLECHFFKQLGEHVRHNFYKSAPTIGYRVGLFPDELENKIHRKNYVARLRHQIDSFECRPVLVCVFQLLLACRDHILNCLSQTSVLVHSLEGVARSNQELVLVVPFHLEDFAIKHIQGILDLCKVVALWQQLVNDKFL